MAELTRGVLVTGAAGRVGRATLDLLAREGVPAGAPDLRDPGGLRADRVDAGRADGPETMREALDDVDAVIHLAAIPAAGEAS
ncbi:NAD-dependent epimerase/dehydratase family protein [Microbispora hainanensis]|uniref:NAD-dependent epimerase/dehydratase family protein n=1 Tax=Microbispora hainanensis TaxID=568844 RepID=A0A544XUW9_9ACTN|nr:NAD-dependent epimerase/dehydratase family protein [Microbispora hainanensis]TQS08298.1 NAD-dependent epimerase/dehydratase family protein [Microbispora hainanensis]